MENYMPFMAQRVVNSKSQEYKTLKQSFKEFPSDDPSYPKIVLGLKLENPNSMTTGNFFCIVTIEKKKEFLKTLKGIFFV